MRSMHFAAVAVLLAAAPAFSYHSLIHVFPVSDLEAALVVNSGADIVHVYRDGSADAVLSLHDMHALDRTGVRYEVRVENLDRLYELRCQGLEMGGYMTWDEIQDWLDQLHADYPSITSAPTSIGDTYQGRPQLVMKLGTDNSFYNDDPSRPNCWYDGLIHAREPATMDNICHFMEWLCVNHGRDGYCGLVADYVLENRDVWCLPCNNVDGYVYNESIAPGGGGMHRKNMNWSLGNGIDLNRNWSVAWGGPGSSGDPNSETYRGTAPLSEPETSNIDDFWQTCTPVQMHSTHSYGNILIYPWGWTDDPTTHAAQYEAQGEIMVNWATGELHGPAAEINYYSSGNTRDHSYGLYGTMSWNHETGSDFAGFWPDPDEVISLHRRNLRSYLVTALLAACPLDPHVPGVPVVDPIGTVGQTFTVDWTDVSGCGAYGLQELEGYQVLLDDDGSSGPFTMSNWSVTSSQYHSSPQSYGSNGTGTMTWQGSAIIPATGGGRFSFWSYNSVPNGYCQGSFDYSPDGGANWHYLQTFTRIDPVWRFNIHELDEFQGQTVLFRWRTQGSSSHLYIDDIRCEVWDENDFVDLDIPVSTYTFTGHAPGEFWYRAMALDEDFGWSWPSGPEQAIVEYTGVDDQ
ncbi:zinc carboxypeptidase, partial [Candidatus Fermentibacterales bacterium]|nr:zinc carboxypeptidase [Candidatus Fermentibacterales bacterium]